MRAGAGVGVRCRRREGWVRVGGQKGKGGRVADGFVPCKWRRRDSEVCGDFVPCGRESEAVAGVVEGAGACKAGLDGAASFWAGMESFIAW